VAAGLAVGPVAEDVALAVVGLRRRVDVEVGSLLREERAGARIFSPLTITKNFVGTVAKRTSVVSGLRSLPTVLESPCKSVAVSRISR
jgi:hypothetical protein